MGFTFDNLRSLAGIFTILGLAWCLSAHKRSIPLRTVGAALALQLAVAICIFALPPIRQALGSVSIVIKALLAASAKGSQFAFGYIAGGPPPFEVTAPGNNFNLALQVLPLMIVVSAIAALLWHWGALARICRALGSVFRRALGLSGPVSLGVAASIFLGMVEAPLIVRPYLERMSRADVFLIMTTSMATIAGTMMAVYIALTQQSVPDAAAHVLVASFMGAPGAVAIARIMQPPEADSAEIVEKPPPRLYQSSLDAFMRGVQDGLNVYLSVIATIIVSVAFVTLIDMTLAALFPACAGEPLTTGRLLGWALAPLMYMLGIPWKDSIDAGMLLGTKTMLNELLAFIELGKLPPDQMEPRSRMMMIYALCGFANFGAVAVMVGGLSAMCPGRRSDFLQLGLKSLISGTAANLLNCALIGLAPLALLGVG